MNRFKTKSDMGEGKSNETKNIIMCFEINSL